MLDDKLHKDIAKFIGNENNTQAFEGYLGNNFDFLMLPKLDSSIELNEPDHDFYNIKIW